MTLANIMARLRAPDGCPWDIEQTHASLTRALIEEAYEVVEAISDGDMGHLQEELGDLWLHVLFQTQIARDEDEFSLSQVGQELAAKLIRRHPHVFGDEEAADAVTVLANWERIKGEEKRSKGDDAGHDALDAGIPRELPGLVRAQKVQERARRQGVGVRNGSLPRSVVRELKRRRGAARARVFGEMLFDLARLAEAEGIDAERAVRAATRALVKKNQHKSR
jgi:tetrapyrrole methylase family protein/MazG family protein